MFLKDVSHSFDKFLFLFLRRSCILSYAILFTIILYVVVIRHLKLSSVFWIDDIINLLIVWMVFMGSVLVARENDHINIPFLIHLLRKKSRFFNIVIAIFNQVLVLFFLLFLLKGVWDFMSVAAFSNLPRIPIAKSWWLLPVFISTLLMLIYSLKKIFSLIQRRGDFREI